MNQFIIVTLRKTKRKCRININHITNYIISKNNDYTFIYLLSSNYREVSETPEEIDKLLHQTRTNLDTINELK